MIFFMKKPKKTRKKTETVKTKRIKPYALV